MTKLFFLKALLICGLLNGCMFNHKKLLVNSNLYAKREGVANCMTYLYFQKDNKVVQKSLCFGISTTNGTYKFNKDYIDIYWKIPGKSDTIIHDIAKIKKYTDRIGHVYKKLIYYRNGDTLSNPLIYNAFDDETKCLDYNTKIDSSDIRFIFTRFTKQGMNEYEDSLNSVKIKGNFTLSKDYYPNNRNLNLETPIVFDRKYKIGIPLTTSYLFCNDTLMVQFHEWSDTGVECMDNFNRESYIEIYKQIIYKIIKIKGQPIKIAGDLTNHKTTQFERIWDNENNI